MSEQLVLHGVALDCRAVPCAHCPRIAAPESYLRRTGIFGEVSEPKPLCDRCTAKEVGQRIDEGQHVPEELMRKYGGTTDEDEETR